MQGTDLNIIDLHFDKATVEQEKAILQRIKDICKNHPFKLAVVYSKVYSKSYNKYKPRLKVVFKNDVDPWSDLTDQETRDAQSLRLGKHIARIWIKNGIKNLNDLTLKAHNNTIEEGLLQQIKEAHEKDIAESKHLKSDEYKKEKIILEYLQSQLDILFDANDSVDAFYINLSAEITSFLEQCNAYPDWKKKQLKSCIDGVYDTNKIALLDLFSDADFKNVITNEKIKNHIIQFLQQNGQTNIAECLQAGNDLTAEHIIACQELCEDFKKPEFSRIEEVLKPLMTDESDRYTFNKIQSILNSKSQTGFNSKAYNSFLTTQACFKNIAKCINGDDKIEYTEAMIQYEPRIVAPIMDDEKESKHSEILMQMIEKYGLKMQQNICPAIDVKTLKLHKISDDVHAQKDLIGTVLNTRGMSIHKSLLKDASLYDCKVMLLEQHVRMITNALLQDLYKDQTYCIKVGDGNAESSKNKLNAILQVAQNKPVILQLSDNTHWITLCLLPDKKSPTTVHAISMDSIGSCKMSQGIISDFRKTAQKFGVEISELYNMSVNGQQYNNCCGLATALNSYAIIKAYEAYQGPFDAYKFNIELLKHVVYRTITPITCNLPSEPDKVQQTKYDYDGIKYFFANRAVVDKKQEGKQYITICYSGGHATYEVTHEELTEIAQFKIDANTKQGNKINNKFTDKDLKDFVEEIGGLILKKLVPDEELRKHSSCETNLTSVDVNGTSDKFTHSALQDLLKNKNPDESGTQISSEDKQLKLQDDFGEYKKDTVYRITNAEYDSLCAQHKVVRLLRKIDLHNEIKTFLSYDNNLRLLAKMFRNDPNISSIKDFSTKFEAVQDIIEIDEELKAKLRQVADLANSNNPIQIGLWDAFVMYLLTNHRALYDTLTMFTTPRVRSVHDIKVQLDTEINTWSTYTDARDTINKLLPTQQNPELIQ